MSASNKYIGALVLLSAFVGGCQQSSSGNKPQDHGTSGAGKSAQEERQAPNTFVKLKDTDGQGAVAQDEMMNCISHRESFESELAANQAFIRKYSFGDFATTLETLKIVGANEREVSYELTLVKTDMNGASKTENYKYTSAIAADGKFKSGQPAFNVGRMPKRADGCKIIDITASQYTNTYEVGKWSNGEGVAMPATKIIAQKEQALVCPGKKDQSVMYSAATITSPKVLRLSAYCVPQTVYEEQTVVTTDGEIIAKHENLLVSAPLRK